jgi:surface antigen
VEENTSHGKLVAWIVLPLVALLGMGTVLVVTFGYSMFFGKSAADAGSGCNPVGSAEDQGIIAQGPSNASTTDEQVNNAKKIDQVVKDVGLSGKASKIAITAAMGESSLMNLNSGDEGAGVTNPDGSATTSKGLFQQQTSTGWGTVEQVTNPEYATKSFLLGKSHDGKNGGLVSIPNWQDQEITLSINKVQSNSDPNHYAQFYAEADKVIQKAGIDVNREGDESAQKWKAEGNGADEGKSTGDNTSSGFTCAGAKGKDGNNGDSSEVGDKDKANTYPWEPAPPPDTFEQDPMGFFFGECTSYVAWRLNEDMGGSKTDLKFSNTSHGVKKGNGYEWKKAWMDKGWKVSNKPVPGAVAYYDAFDGEGIGAMGHVAYVNSVTDDGKAVISEYNNAGYAPPGHKFDVRPQPVEPDKVSAFLYPPPK